MFKAIAGKFREMRQRSANKQEFLDRLMSAMSDGVLTDEEVLELDQLKSEMGLTEDDIRKMKVTAYHAAYAATKDDGAVTAEEERDLSRIQNYLQIPDVEIDRTKHELRRLRLIYEIENGYLPTVTATGLVLQKSEQVHWIEPASLLEERVVGRQSYGRSSGVSIRIAKGVSYRVGASRGYSVPITDIVPVSTGEVVFTNKRIIFRGSGKNFTLKLEKVIDFQLFNNGMSLSGETGKPKLIKFASKDNSDVVGVLLTRILNH